MPGFDLSRFDQTIEQDFVCSICFGVFFDPVQDKCEHLFCRDCIFGWLEKNDATHLTGRCPLCLDQIAWADMRPASRIVKSLLSNLEIRCKFKEHGCARLVKYDLINDHERDCKFRLLPKGCGATLINSQGLSQDYTTHLKSIVEELTNEVETLKSICEFNQKEIDKLKSCSHALVSLLDTNAPNIERGIGQIELTIKSAARKISARNGTTSTEIMYIYTSHRKFASRDAVTDYVKSLIASRCPKELVQGGQNERMALVVESSAPGASRELGFGVFKVLMQKQVFDLIVRPNLWPPEMHCVVPGHLIRGFQGTRKS